MARTFPFGYRGSWLTLPQLLTKKTVALLDPETRRCIFAMMTEAASQDIPLGIGTGWRIQPDPPPPGFAEPGNSHHESMPAGSNTATAFAADMVPASSWKWMEANCARFHLRTFLHVNNEPWHVQHVAIPAGRQYRVHPYTLPRLQLPGETPVPSPTPIRSLEELPMLASVAKTTDGPHLAQFGYRTAVLKMGSTKDHDVTTEEVFGRGDTRAYCHNTQRVVSWTPDNPGSWAGVKANLTTAQARARMLG